MELNKSLTKKRALELIDNKLEEFRVLSYEVSTSDNTMKITADSMASKDKRSDQYIEERGKRAFDEYQRLEANYKALYSSTIALIARITPQDGVSYFESKEREYRTHREEYANKPPEKKRHWTLGLLMGVGSVALSVLEALLTTGQSALTSNITPVVKALEEYKALIVNAVPDDREYS